MRLLRAYLCYNEGMRERVKATILAVMAAVGVVVAVRPVVAEEAKTDLSQAKVENIVRNCESIRETLVGVQHSDSRARVYLGRYYETMLSGFITPLNVWLVGQSISDVELIENQNSFATVRGEFMNNYIAYQKGLEELVATNCIAEPEKFYEKLTSVRKARAKVEANAAKLRKLMDEQVKLVKELKKEMK